MNTDEIALWASKLTTSDIEKLPFCIGRKDLQHRFIDATLHCSRLKGVRNSEQLRGLRAAELPCPSAAYADYYEIADKECMRRNEVTSQVAMYRYPKGEYAAILIKRYPMYSASLEIKGSLFISLDITAVPTIMLSNWFDENDRYFQGDQMCGKGKILTILHDDNFMDLSKSETELLFFIVRGYSNKQVAIFLGIEQSIVDDSVHQLMAKMGCLNKRQVIDKAVDLDFIDVIPGSLLQINDNLALMN